MLERCLEAAITVGLVKTRPARLDDSTVSSFCVIFEVVAARDRAQTGGGNLNVD